MSRKIYHEVYYAIRGKKKYLANKEEILKAAALKYRENTEEMAAKCRNRYKPKYQRQSRYR